jgi:hypothetical protein
LNRGVVISSSLRKKSPTPFRGKIQSQRGQLFSAPVNTQLQTAREAKEAQQQNDAIALLTHFTTAGKSWNPADFGFVWSIEEIQLLEERQFLRNRACKAATA